MTDASGPPEPRRRLHPLSPLLHSAKSLTVIVGAISYQGYSQLGFLGFVCTVGVLLVGASGLAVVSWYTTGYHVVGRELRVYEGVLWRRTRAIPLERLQSVEVVRPPLARLTGLTELRLEVVGGGRTEAPLAYLSSTDAVALRDRLLSLAGRSPATGPAAAPGWDGAFPSDGRVPGESTPQETVPGPAELHAVPSRDVVISQLLTPQVWFLPLALAFVVVQAVFEASFSLLGIASTVTAMAGVILQPARRVFDDWSFRIRRDSAGLLLQHGLLETRSQTVPVDRVQAVEATWPLLWRSRGWLRLRLSVAGVAGPSSGQHQGSSQLLPVGEFATARRLLAEVLPGVDLTGLRLVNPPARARWLAPLAQPRMGVALTDQVVAVGRGVLTRRLTLVPYARIQSVRVTRGPLQRRLRLATVYADTAGGPAAAAEHRPADEAFRLAQTLTDRARAARRPPAAATGAGRSTSRP